MNKSLNYMAMEFFMGEKLKIPNELIEPNSRVYWTRESLGFTAIEKCQLLFDFNKVNGTIIAVGTKVYGNKSCSTIKYQCNVCCSINEQLLYDLINGSYCSKCANKKRSLTKTGRKHKKSGLRKNSTIEQIQQIVDSCYDGKRVFIVLLKFVKNKQTCIRVKCVACDIVYDKQFEHIRRKTQCSCSKRKTWNDAFAELNNANITGKDVFDEKTIQSFKGCNYAITIFCKDCSKYYEILYRSYVSQGARCSSCSYSYNEFHVQQYLEQHHIEFKREQTFNGCIHKSKLRFDFYVPKLNLIIETHGKQHYEIVEHWHKKDGSFEESQLRDSIKRKFIKDNGFNYLEIDCREFNSQTKIFNMLHSYIFSLKNLLKLNQSVIL